jgi:protein-tyrosine phosphatase
VEFGVLMVCTGNICRSPAAQLLLRRRLAALPVDVSSAGTGGLTGHEMDAPSAQALLELGVDPFVHLARRLTHDQVERAGLILTADSSHRSRIVQDAPLSFRRTFTMREFARLGADLADLPDGVAVTDSEALRMALDERVGVVAAQRGWVEPAAPGGDDIGDPLGGGIVAARTAVSAIAEAIDGVITSLGLRSRVAQLQPE